MGDIVRPREGVASQGLPRRVFPRGNGLTSTIKPWLVITRPRILEPLVFRILEDRHGHRERGWAE